MKTSTILACLSVSLAAMFVVAGEDWTNRFRADFSEYAEGEALSSKGATGGKWNVSEGVTAKGVTYDGRKAISISTYQQDDLRFSATEPIAPGKTARVEFSMCVDGFSLDLDLEPKGASAALVTTLDDNGQPTFAGWTSAGWVKLHGDVKIEAGKWIDGCIEFRTVGSIRLVSYVVQTEKGDVRLLSPTGDAWLRTRPADAHEVSSVSYYGNGRISRLSGDDRPPVSVTTYRWVGGASGGWDDPANWTDEAGGAVSCAPGADGDLAVLEGSVSLTNGTESVVARDLVIEFVDGAAQRIEGSLSCAVTMDVSRPRIGKELAASVGTFLGVEPNYDYAWYRGGYNRMYPTTPIGTAKSRKLTADDCGQWLKFVAKDGAKVVMEKEFFCSRLPVVYIDTDDGKAVTVKDVYKTAQLRIQGNDEFKEQYNGVTEIKGRGNSSWGYPKKPYKLKLDKKTNIFDYGKNKHWVLLSNWLDECFVRNWLAGDIATRLNVLRMNMTWVDVVLNGDFKGNYMFGEHVRVDSNRIDVFDWSDVIESDGHEETDLSWLDNEDMDFSGGYVFELSHEYDEVSKFTTSNGLKVMVNTPEYAYTSQKMFGAMQKIWADYENAYRAEDGYNANGIHYTELADLASMVGYWLTQETMGNNDASYKSRYVYKDRGGKLMFGPVWDFDWGCGSAAVGTGATGWKVSTRNDGANFFREWMDDPLFCLRAYELYWNTLRPYMMEQILAKGGTLESKFAYLSESAAADNQLWANTSFQWTRRWFTSDAQMFTTYLTQRMAWLDGQFTSLDAFVKNAKISGSASPYTKDDTKLAFSVMGGQAIEKAITKADYLVTNAKDAKVIVTVNDSAIKKVHYYVNGLKVGVADVSGGKCSFVIDCTLLDAAAGTRNLVSVIAKNSTGSTVARNFMTLLEDDTPESQSVAETLVQDYGFEPDSSVVNNVTTVAEFAQFRDFYEMARGGTVTPAQKRFAYESYRVSALTEMPHLFSVNPQPEIVDLQPGDEEGGWLLTVELKDGDDPVALAVEAFKDTVRKSDNLSEWTAINAGDVKATAAEGNRVTLQVKPAFTGDQGFLRLEVK